MVESVVIKPYLAGHSQQPGISAGRYLAVTVLPSVTINDSSLKKPGYTDIFLHLFLFHNSIEIKTFILVLASRTFTCKFAYAVATKLQWLHRKERVRHSVLVCPLRVFETRIVSRLDQRSQTHRSFPETLDSH